MPTKDGAIRVANCSGFYGDRVAAAREMVEGGPIDYLTGDWLAELTMYILSRNAAKTPAAGYARTFVTQMEQVMGTCLDRGIKVVSNAGGLNPRACAEAVADVAARLGIQPRIAYVEGDDLVGRLPELLAAGHDLANMDTGQPLSELGVEVLTANAYLGCWGIVEALERGADIVVTGRVTDAAVVMGPPAHHFGWKRDDWDRLAGACVAGHVIECGAQATGGNYAFFREVPGMEHLGFPLAEMRADGSSVITKHPGTGGQVSIGTVTSQLLYEIGGPRYANPDVVCRFDTIRLDDDGPDRVRISATRGEPAPPTLKVAMNYLGGYRNGFTFALTGLDVEAKADLLERQLWRTFPGGRDHFDQVRTQLIRTDKDDPHSNEEAVALYKVTVKDRDERKVGRSFANVAVELGLASIPGFFGTSGAPGPRLALRRVLAGSRPLRSGPHVGDAPRRGHQHGRQHGPGPAVLARRGADDRSACPAGRPHRARAAGPGVRGPLGRQGRQRQRGHLRPDGLGLRLAGAVPHRRALPGAVARHGALPGRALPAAQPVVDQLRGQGPAGGGRGRLVTPGWPGQGPG